MIENGIRGGISQCSNRHAKANNKYMGKKFDESKDSIFIEYLDANNLYGWAMSKYLPYGGFNWGNTDIDVLKIADDSPKGYILEVDIADPEELHDSHSDFPLAPENKIADYSPKGYILEVDVAYPEELHDSHSDVSLAPENKIGNEKLPKLLTTL